MMALLYKSNYDPSVNSKPDCRRAQPNCVDVRGSLQIIRVDLRMQIPWTVLGRRRLAVRRATIVGGKSTYKVVALSLKSTKNE